MVDCWARSKVERKVVLMAGWKVEYWAGPKWMVCKRAGTKAETYVGWRESKIYLDLWTAVTLALLK